MINVWHKAIVCENPHYGGFFITDKVKPTI